jgi:hypothetical protein
MAGDETEVTSSARSDDDPVPQGDPREGTCQQDQRDGQIRPDDDSAGDPERQ